MLDNANKFGYYTVGNKKTYSKYEAFEWGTPTWHFNDEVFSSYDWKKEPDISLSNLYKNRVRQIREKYDYCVLWYSGGSDSHNILQAWLDSGCKLDEVATTWNYETTGEYYNHYNAEITHVVLQDIKKLKDKGFDFNFRLLNIPEYGLKTFAKFNNDLEYHFNYNLQLSSIGKQFIRDEVKDYKNLIEQGKKVCFIWGKEKPYIFYEDGRYYFSFIDSIDDCLGPYTQSKFNSGWYDELFYWTPDMPELAIKAAHVIFNFLKISDDVSCFRSEPYDNYSCYSNKLNMHLKINVLKKLLYPKWSDKIYCNGKSPTRILGLRDDWFTQSDSKQLDIMLDILTNYNKIAGKTNTKALCPIYSKKYWLE